jgi:hypothetical protein
MQACTKLPVDLTLLQVARLRRHLLVEREGALSEVKSRLMCDSGGTLLARSQATSDEAVESILRELGALGVEDPRELSADAGTEAVWDLREDVAIEGRTPRAKGASLEPGNDGSPPT